MFTCFLTLNDKGETRIVKGAEVDVVVRGEEDGGDSVSEKSCTALASALCTNPSHIRELDLRGCELGDSGVEKLCDLLKKHECKLETLRLWDSVSEKSGTALASALCTNPSHIRELDLSWCELGDSGVEKLCDLLKKHECKLETLL
ncbi:ribonuclease inhibitor-like [Neoarius graeffei]|uniref:ribonuclease inhibitor-like n=1 Tax=Neoarius graeffei TaxID=443677 RepID=UPI00298C4215|nr:ribonuclease inhibitor-like [Neoarius graeffei]